MNVVRLSATVDVPVASAFAYVDDHTRVQEWVYGFRKFVPLTEQTNGVGAVYDAEIKAGARLPARVEVIEHVPNELIAMQSIHGIESRFRLTFRAVDDTTTELSSEVHYAFPGGMAGRAMEKLVAPLVHVATRYVEHTIKVKAEEAHARGEV